jgi:uncharacterized small protein (DUF1192 family)
MSKIQDDAYSEAMDEIARSKAALARLETSRSAHQTDVDNLTAEIERLKQ